MYRGVFFDDIIVYSKTFEDLENQLRKSFEELWNYKLYVDDKKRLKTLVPLREYVTHVFPPKIELIQPIQKAFSKLLNLYKETYGILASAQSVHNSITVNRGNLDVVLKLALKLDNPDLHGTIRGVLIWIQHDNMSGYATGPLMDNVAEVIPAHDHEIQMCLEQRSAYHT